MSSDGPKKKYEVVRPLYEGLALTASNTIKSLLQKEKIDFLTVDHRTKTLESFSGKIKKKKYADPLNEITDLAGIRIITFIESDVLKVLEIVRQIFSIHSDHSLDKSSELGTDRVGYRSVHYVCDLGAGRHGLPEYERFRDLRFEVQIRTVLQHAWAEIEHDRNYKFSTTLPDPLRRRLSLIAGMLEIADREFDQIASEIDGYTAKVIKMTKIGDLDVEINSASLGSYLPELFKKEFGLPLSSEAVDSKIISELHDFGLKTLADLKLIFTSDIMAIMKKNSGIGQNVPSLIREAMILVDIDKYFTLAWRQHWTAVDIESVNIWKKRWPSSLVDNIIANTGMRVFDHDEYYQDLDTADESFVDVDTVEEESGQ